MVGKTMDIDDLIDAARVHGEQSEAEHELGDLQTILRACWEIMDSGQKRELVEEFEELVDEWQE